MSLQSATFRRSVRTAGYIDVLRGWRRQGRGRIAAGVFMLDVAAFAEAVHASNNLRQFGVVIAHVRVQRRDRLLYDVDAVDWSRAVHSRWYWG